MANTTFATPMDSTSTTCAPSTPEPEEPIQSTLWFDDGNLIIHAPPVQFKVYAGMLAARSSVFRDMLAFPPPAEGNEHVNGCVVVQLYGDDPKEVRWFLRAIFDSSFFEPPPTSTTLPVVHGILRLARKYDVPYLYTRAIAHLHTTFPTTYVGWLERDDKRTIPPIDNTPFAALRIAREFELDWLIPSVMYCVSSHPIEKSMDGAEWCPPPDDDEEEWTKGRRKERREKGETIHLMEHEKKTAVCCRAQLSVMQNQAGIQLVRSGGARECEPLPRNMLQTGTTTPNAPAAAAGTGNGAVAINFNVPINAPPGAPLPLGGAQTPNPPPGNANPFNNMALPPVVPPNPNPTNVPINIVPLTCPHTRLRLAEIIASLPMVGFLDFYNERGEMICDELCAPCKAVVKGECERLAGEMWDALPRFSGLEGWGVLEGRRKAVMRQ